MDGNDFLMEPREAAEYIKTKQEHLAQLRWQGKGPAYVKIGRLVRYRKSAVDEWLGSNTVTRASSGQQTPDATAPAAPSKWRAA